MDPVRSIPVLHLHYAHAIMAAVARHGPVELEWLLAQGNPEDLFKGSREHRSPLERARQLVNYARLIGLMGGARDTLELTPAGRAYVAAGDRDDVFATTHGQARILQQLIELGARDGGVARGATLALGIVAERRGRITATELGEQLSRRGDVGSWRASRTFQAQGERYRALLEDARLVDGDDVTAPGTALLGKPSLRSTLDRDERAPRVWLIRAGREGRYEALALRAGVCLIGWSELGALDPRATREQLKQRIAEVYGEERPRSLASQAGQIHRFLSEVAIGDVVVLPRLSDPGHVAVGRVSGGYRHRTAGPFAGTDAQHTRPVEWLAEQIPYERFDRPLVRAFGQQGTVSEIGVTGAAQQLLDVAHATPRDAVHLLLKWSPRLGPDTIERHREVADHQGAVWWGRVSSSNRPGLGTKWVRQLRQQLERDVPTSVFLHGGNKTWRARLLAVTTREAEVERELVPAYYRPETRHTLWVKLADFEPVDSNSVIAGYVLATDGRPVTRGALGNQTPVILAGPPGAPVVSPPPPPPPAVPFDLAALRAAVQRRGLLLAPETCVQVLAGLESGKHLILTGPPGTAKTTLAQAIAEVAEAAGRCDGHLLTTATADWTTYETIGGLRPNGDGALAFAEGHFLTAIRGNRWLVIDELNRSQFDRAFGQLFTVLSGQPVVLPYADPESGQPLALVPESANGDAPADVSAIPIPGSWRIVATMNVFDKTLLFEMSFALMRRLHFVEVVPPDDDGFAALIERRANGTARAAELTRSLLPLRALKDLGPAVFMDVAGYLHERLRAEDADNGQLLFESFYGFLLPQFEGIDDRRGRQLFEFVGGLVGGGLRERLRRTLESVLGLDLSGPQDAAAA